jgi:hypothetical protein
MMPTVANSCLSLTGNHPLVAAAAAAAAAVAVQDGGQQ